jgi:N-sulfoglucosamine sulfohydrolase
MEKKTTRRTFIKNGAAAAIALGAGSVPLLSGCGKEFSTDPAKPNVLFITADDLGWKDTGCYGNRAIATPGLDRLAGEGVRFTNAFVASSSCAPSRATFITGQYPHTHGVTGLTHIYKTRFLSPFHRTLPELLRDAGYNTALQGKWHVSPYMPTSWYGYNERLSGVLPGDWHIDDETRAVDFIRRNRNNRFYLELNFIQNHRNDYGEFAMDPGFPVERDGFHVPEYMALPDWPEVREDLAKYYSQTMRMDHIIGKILDALDELNLTENTLVIFISDNGPPYPGNKMTLYDRGIGEPYLIRWPARVSPGRTVSHLVNSIDLMPTILESCGIGIPGDVQGISNFSLATGASLAPLREAIFMEMTNHVHYIPTRAVRTEKWKYIRNYSNIAFGLDEINHKPWAHRLCELPNQPWKKPRVSEELYDLGSDPHEQVNLAGKREHGAVLDAMRARLRKHMAATGDPFLNRTFTSDYDAAAYVPSRPREKLK